MKSISTLFQFKTLNTKITIIFLMLILVIQATGYFTTRYNIEKNARLAATEQLSVGEHIFNNLLAQNSKNLTQAAKILATDYGFREAVSSKDTETIVSALENYRGRIGATIALFHDASGQYVTGTANEDRQDANKSIALLIKNAEGQGSVAGIVVMDNVPYQLVILPVKAPLLVGWVTMGFAVDDELANSVHSLSALDVTFLIKTADGKLIPVATTLDKSDAAHLSQISQDALNNGLTST